MPYLKNFCEENYYKKYYKLNNKDTEGLKDSQWGDIHNELNEKLIKNDETNALFAELKKIKIAETIEEHIGKITAITDNKDKKLKVPWREMLKICLGKNPSVTNIEYKSGEEDISPYADPKIIANITDEKPNDKSNIEFNWEGTCLKWLLGGGLSLFALIVGTGIYCHNDFSYKYSWAPLLAFLTSYIVINKTCEAGKESLIKTVEDELVKNLTQLKQKKDKKIQNESNVLDTAHQTLINNSKTMNIFYLKNKIKYFEERIGKDKVGEDEKIKNMKEDYQKKLQEATLELYELTKNSFFEEK